MTDRAARLDPGEMGLLPFGHEELERSLVERFASVAMTWPAAVAIASGTERVTYRQLAHRSDALAAAIGRPPRGSGTAPVAILLGDPVSMITGILATWKAAKLCVPLDPTLPPARLKAILHDCEAGLIVTDRSGSAALSPLPGTSSPQLLLDSIDLGAAVDPPCVEVTPDTLACLLYTSGSTGQPKGVLRSNRVVLHRARCSIMSLAIRPEDRVSALHSPAFGGGLRDVMTALLSGAALLPFDLRRAGLRSLANWIDQEEISVLCTVVTTMRHLLATLGPEARFPSVRVVRLGGEPLYRPDVERLRQRLRPDCVLIAGYGASEASGIVEYRMAQDTPLPAGRVPAGYAIEGVEIVLLDNDGHPVGAGTGRAGEVAVRSRYLSQGYWQRPDLTRAMFLPDLADGQMRTYRTGDIGRLMSDGCLEVFGRNDHQVKVNGYLVHPSEIEAALVEHPAIREAVVTAQADSSGPTRVAAYVVPHTWPAPYAQVLRRYLQARLPAYMVPSAFISLETLPLNVSGKVDRAALPPPPRPAAHEADFVSPRSPTEHQIAAIWEELFGVSPIGANDNFFDLGGDSLLAVAFMAAIEETCGRVLLPSVLLEASTVADLAATMFRTEGGCTERVTALRASGERSPLFFLHNDYAQGFYTHALARSVDPSRPFYAVHLHGLDGPALPATVEAIAANRLQAVRDARRHGPYVLGGHCHGGLIALEIARQLRAEGERVEAVVMIDTRAPALSLRALGQVSEVVGRLRGRPPDQRAGLMMRVDRARETIEGWAGRMARALEGCRECREKAPARDVPPELAEAWQRFRRAIRRYVPARYVGLVALFRAEECPARRPDLGWSRLLPRLEVGVVPGDHHTCITRHVATLGARLEDVLRRVDTGS